MATTATVKLRALALVSTLKVEGVTDSTFGDSVSHVLVSGFVS
ncbi:unannotated protein [freshwater metagenome]|uniref:Unannotated protein n=1 Tax=freshwater metagenome TaxID=449393 RepID=A0A6J7TRE5_9ZZZZ